LITGLKRNHQTESEHTKMNNINVLDINLQYFAHLLNSITDMWKHEHLKYIKV